MQALSVLQWKGTLAALLSGASLMAIMIGIPTVMSIVAQMEEELAVHRSEFNQMSNSMWRDLMQLSGHIRNARAIRDRGRRNYGSEGYGRYEGGSSGGGGGGGERGEEGGYRGEGGAVGGQKSTDDSGNVASEENKCPAGPIGPPGIPGERGEDGEPGIPGQPGKAAELLTPKKGPCAPCPPGPPGLLGYKGPRGPRGPVGEKGPPGPAGRDGEDGEQGEEGEPGAPGEEGPKGEKGSAGESGVRYQGVRGPKGPAGPVGPQGDEGPPGERGEDGPPGPKGDIGPPGPPGTPGRIGSKGKTGQPGSHGPDGEYCPCPERSKVPGGGQGTPTRPGGGASYGEAENGGGYEKAGSLPTSTLSATTSQKYSRPAIKPSIVRSLVTETPIAESSDFIEEDRMTGDGKEDATSSEVFDPNNEEEEAESYEGEEDETVRRHAVSKTKRAQALRRKLRKLASS